MGVSMGIPSHHPYFDKLFHDFPLINHPAIGGTGYLRKAPYRDWFGSLPPPEASVRPSAHRWPAGMIWGSSTVNSKLFTAGMSIQIWSSTGHIYPSSFWLGVCPSLRHVDLFDHLMLSSSLCDICLQEKYSHISMVATPKVSQAVQVSEMSP